MNPPLDYYKLPAGEICDRINRANREVITSLVEGVPLVVFPHVYPSHQFRTTEFVLGHLKGLFKGKRVCDMGCGPGIVGLYAMHNGARRVVQADINPIAVENARENNFLQGFPENRIGTWQSDCFDNVPKDIFDMIVFNMPYDNDKVKIEDPLQYAIYDPAFSSINKFLKQARDYSNKKTRIFIAFSSKGDTALLESLFEQHHYVWKIWKITNKDQMYDNRIYLLSFFSNSCHRR